MRTSAMKQRMGLPSSDDPLALTKQLQEQFLDSLKASGRKKYSSYRGKRFLTFLREGRTGHRP